MSFQSRQEDCQAGFLHFSPRSRDQRKAHMLMYHHRLPSPAPSLVSKAAPTKSAACWRMEYGIVPGSPTGTTGRYDMVSQLFYTRPETQDSCMVRLATFKVRTKDLIHHFQDVDVIRCF